MSQQAGTIAWRQLRALGLSDRSIARRVEARSLVRRTEHVARPAQANGRARNRPAAGGVASSVFTGHGGPMSVAALRWRAVLSAPDGARLGGISSCAALGLEPQRGQTMHVWKHGAGWHPPRGVVAHRTRHMPGQDLDEVDGLPVFTVARSCLDAAVQVDADRLDDIVDQAVSLRVYDELDMRRVIDERPTFRGARLLTAALDRLDERSGEFVRGFERRTVRLIQRSDRIPPVVVNVLIHGRRPDIHVLGTRVIIECDGRDYHRTLKQINADEAREAELRARGYVFLRLRWRQVVHDEERTLQLIERFVLENLAPPIPTS